jgi:hypothetical protein
MEQKIEREMRALSKLRKKIGHNRNPLSDHEPNIMRVSRVGWMTTKLSLEQQPEASLYFLGSSF